MNRAPSTMAVPDTEKPFASRHDAVTEQLTTQIAKRSDTLFVVSVVEGPSFGTSVALERSSGRVLVGTSEACHLKLTDRAVSRRHVALEVHGELLRVTDQGSTNGTVLDGARVADAFAVAGSMVRIGETLLFVTASAAEPKNLPAATSFGRMIGASVTMRRLYPLFERLAQSDVPILIEGEPGTGKELLAEVLHERGPRAAAPFVVVDASSSPDTDDELFGAGRAFERARGGTLLVDHVSELPLATQVKLLRATSADPANAGGPRIIATSRRDLDKDVEAGALREDLFFHLVVGRVELPPLRSRGEDVRLLAEHFWKKLDGGSGSPLPPDFLRRYDGHGWTHNVRELLAAVARRAAVGDADDIVDVPSDEGAPQHAFRWVLDRELPFPTAKNLLIAEFERAFVEKALARHGGNVSRAAAASGLARRYFQIIRARLRG